MFLLKGSKMVINVKNLLTVLWPGAVLLVWSLWLFGTALLSVTLHVLALVYLMSLPFYIGDILEKDSKE
jgi:hypothetical protein